MSWKSLRINQTNLAKKSGVALATVRLSETSGGKLSTFNKLISEMGYMIKGQSLPAGQNIGSSLKVLRLRHKLTLRELASRSDVSVPTLFNIEAGNDCYLIKLEKIAGVLGAKLFLHTVDKQLSFYHGGLSNSSNFTGWTTPDWVLERLYPIVGGEFSLDPCSPTTNKNLAPVKAQTYYTGTETSDCGLTQPWQGQCFVNPPYGRELIKWVMKCDSEYSSGNVDLIIAILPLRSDVKYWQEYIAYKTSILFFQGRLQFGASGDNCGKAPFSSVLAIWSNDQAILLAIKLAFPEHWFVYGEMLT